MVPTRKARDEKDVGNKVSVAAERQRGCKNSQGEGGSGQPQSKTSGDLFSRALHQLIQDGMPQKSLEMEGEQGCVAKSRPADPEHPSPSAPGER